MLEYLYGLLSTRALRVLLLFMPPACAASAFSIHKTKVKNRWNIQ